MINHYELLYLVSANFTEDELNPIKAMVSSLITKFGGNITFEDDLGKKKLAYPVEKNNNGYYLLVEFDLEGSKLIELEKSLRLTNEIMRHMVVKRDLKKAAKAKSQLRRNITGEPTSVAPAAKPMAETKVDADKDKLNLEDLDNKLDEILEGDIM